MGKKFRPLTAQHERFVVEYATLMNGKQVALNAGYNKKVASVVACRLLKKPEVMGMKHLGAYAAEKQAVRPAKPAGLE